MMLPQSMATGVSAEGAGDYTTEGAAEDKLRAAELSPGFGPEDPAA